ncbi:hypothetical protein GCM10027273_41450 [Nocardioides pakistanensis]
MVLADDLGERLGPVAAVKGEGGFHVLHPNYPHLQPVAGSAYRPPLETKRPPAHPTELTDPCCLPALGELGEMPPHGGLPQSLGQCPRASQAGRISPSPGGTGNLSRGGFA